MRTTLALTVVKGTITISDLDKHEITSVLVILKKCSEADLTFYADLQLTSRPGSLVLR